MHNDNIAANFSLLAKLMDIHGENSFKSKSYASAAFAIDKLTTQLAEMPPEKIFAIKGIGDAIGKKIIDQLQTGEFTLLIELIQKTPPGIIEMLGIKGIGPKKIATIWKELEIESLGELLYACNENRLTLYKGFGEKSQQNIKEAIEFYMGTLGRYLFAQIEFYALEMEKKLKKAFPEKLFFSTGAFRRQLEIIDVLSWVTTTDSMLLKQFFHEHDFTVLEEVNNYFTCKGKDNVTLGFYCTTNEEVYAQLFRTSCSEEFLTAWNTRHPLKQSGVVASEEAIFTTACINFIPAFQREEPSIIDMAARTNIKTVIQPADIKGIIHSHSNWSDGANTLEEMAMGAIEQGFQYLVISDHSKSAFYANGLYEERILAQHAQINELNEKLAPFVIFKSIESDILNDGSLDYSDAVLDSFDLVIASVHSNLKMSEEKAMVRLLKAIECPFTCILGHMTGRLLLSRNGYPVDHNKIIDACKANNVVIELNAHPRRLDIDWRWISKALDKEVLISINPDAHAIEGFADCRYGVLVAQKAGLTPASNLSSFGLEAFKEFIQQQKVKRKS